MNDHTTSSTPQTQAMTTTTGSAPTSAAQTIERASTRQTLTPAVESLTVCAVG